MCHTVDEERTEDCMRSASSFCKGTIETQNTNLHL